MTARTAREDQAIAVHEAGHCVAVIALGGAVLRATVAPDHRGVGCVDRGHLPPYPSAVVALAGAAAQQVFGYPAVYGGEDARQVSECIPASCHADAWWHAERIVRDRMPAAAAIANALLARRTLTGPEVHQLFRSHP